MSAVLVFLAGIGVGAFGVASLIVVAFVGRHPPPALPPATVRAVRRDRRAARLDLPPARRRMPIGVIRLP